MVAVQLLYFAILFTGIKNVWDYNMAESVKQMFHTMAVLQTDSVAIVSGKVCLILDLVFFSKFLFIQTFDKAPIL